VLISKRPAFGAILYSGLCGMKAMKDCARCSQMLDLISMKAVNDFAKLSLICILYQSRRQAA
jgi:hypothetical protein